MQDLNSFSVVQESQLSTTLLLNTNLTVIADTVAVCIRIDVRGTARGYNVTFLKSCLNAS